MSYFSFPNQRANKVAFSKETIRDLLVEENFSAYIINAEDLKVGDIFLVVEETGMGRDLSLELCAVHLVLDNDGKKMVYFRLDSNRNSRFTRFTTSNLGVMTHQFIVINRNK